VLSTTADRKREREKEIRRAADTWYDKCEKSFRNESVFYVSACNSNNVSNALHLTILASTKPALSV